MALTQRLEMRQSQALVMTPQLMQAIKLLQLSNLDLAAYVEGELEKNPLLERADDGETGRREPAAIGLSRSPSGDGDGRDGGDGERSIGEDLETSRGAIEDRLGTDLDNVFPEDAAPGRAACRRRAARALFGMGGDRHAAAARTATTIWRPSSRPSRRSPIIWPSSSRWRSPIRSGA